MNASFELMSPEEIQILFNSGDHRNNMYGQHFSFSERFCELTGKYHNQGWTWSKEKAGYYFSEGLLHYYFYVVSKFNLNKQFPNQEEVAKLEVPETLNLRSFLRSIYTSTNDTSSVSLKNISPISYFIIIELAKKIKNIPLLCGLGGEYLQLRNLDERLEKKDDETTTELILLISERGIKIESILYNWVRYFYMEMFDYIKLNAEVFLEIFSKDSVGLSDTFESLIEGFQPEGEPAILKPYIDELFVQKPELQLEELKKISPNHFIGDISITIPSQEQINEFIINFNNKKSINVADKGHQEDKNTSNIVIHNVENAIELAQMTQEKLENPTTPEQINVEKTLTEEKTSKIIPEVIKHEKKESKIEITKKIEEDNNAQRVEDKPVSLPRIMVIKNKTNTNLKDKDEGLIGATSTSLNSKKEQVNLALNNKKQADSADYLQDITIRITKCNDYLSYLSKEFRKLHKKLPHTIKFNTDLNISSTLNTVQTYPIDKASLIYRNDSTLEEIKLIVKKYKVIQDMLNLFEDAKAELYKGISDPEVVWKNAIDALKHKMEIPEGDYHYLARHRNKLLENKVIRILLTVVLITPIKIAKNFFTSRIGRWDLETRGQHLAEEVTEGSMFKW